jgi:hypothetical protein
LVLRFLVDKYVTGEGKKLYSCFVDLKKAYDTVPRVKLFYKLFKDYSIGGKFLKILQVLIKMSDGLLQPFLTTLGVSKDVFSHQFCSIFL